VLKTKITPQRKSESSLRTPNKRKAFTLVEVVIASVVASMALLGLLGTAFTAYQINHKARLRDNARAVLRTYVDQFQQLSYSEGNLVRMLFNPTGETERTGLGLRWGELSNQTEFPGAPTAPLQINIGPPNSPQPAFVTRNVRMVNAANGNDSDARVLDAAGFMMRAEFTISYTLSGTGGSTITQRMSTVRLIGN
jgi:prepilin-type N-terminal cleavage/methylation domain-containing protein